MSSFKIDPNDILSLGDVPEDQFAISHYDIDSKFKSMVVASHSPIQLPHSFETAFVKPKLTKDNSGKQWSPKDLKVSRSESSELVVRDAPYLLMRTNFTCALPLDKILDSVEVILQEAIENSYEFIPSECTWKAVYRQGTLRSSFEITVYKGTKNSYIIEAHKLSSGDGLVFKGLYEEIKSSLTHKINSSRSAHFDAFPTSPAPAPTAEITLSEHDIKNTMASIIHLSRDPHVEAMEESARLLYDMSMHDGLQQHLCNSDVFDAFQRFLSLEDETSNGIFDDLKHSTVLAIANISESQIGQTFIIDSGIVSCLLKLVCNGFYGTIEMRRESARVIANVTSKMASKVSSTMSSSDMSEWIEAVDKLEDDRLRMHAARAKTSLATAVF